MTDPRTIAIEALAEALHEWRGRQSLAGCGWLYGSVVNGKMLCPCPADAAAMLAASPRLASLLETGAAVERLEQASHEWHIDRGGGEYGVRVSLVDEHGAVRHAYGFGPALTAAIAAVAEPQP